MKNISLIIFSDELYSNLHIRITRVKQNDGNIFRIRG
jgi:hypothetical protein